MTLEWIGDAILLLVVLPVVVYLLRGVHDAATSIVPSVTEKRPHHVRRYWSGFAGSTTVA